MSDTTNAQVKLLHVPTAAEVFSVSTVKLPYNPVFTSTNTYLDKREQRLYTLYYDDYHLSTLIDYNDFTNYFHKYVFRYDSSLNRIYVTMSDASLYAGISDSLIKLSKIEVLKNISISEFEII